MRLLHVDSSILGGNSVSRTLSAEIVAAEKAHVPGLEVIYRDLAEHPLQHISGSHLSAAQAEAVITSDGIAAGSGRSGAKAARSMSSSPPTSW